MADVEPILTVRSFMLEERAMRTMRSALLLATIAGCAQTKIASRPDDACGEFSSESVGVPIGYTPAGQYSTYRTACAQGETVRILAEQRRASIAAATEAVAFIRQREDGRRSAPETIAHAIAQSIDMHADGRRTRIVVFSPTCGATQGECMTVRGRMESALVRAGNTTVLEYARARDITHELVLQQSDLTDDASVARLGRTLGATHVIFIEVTAIPNRIERLLDLNARCVVVETGMVAAAANAEFAP